MAHVHGRPDNQRDNLNDILGKGPGDPDMHGYPGERQYVGVDKPVVNRTTVAETRRANYPAFKESIDYDPYSDEDFNKFEGDE